MAISYPQNAERFDNLAMIEKQDWMDDVRNVIIEKFGNPYEYGCIIISIGDHDSRIKWAMGFHQNDLKEDIFDLQSAKKYFIVLFDAQTKKKSSIQISAEEYVSNVKFFWEMSKKAGVNNMKSQTNNDINYYIFARTIDGSKDAAVGAFRSCVIVAPAPENRHYKRIQSLRQHLRGQAPE
jgi:hypothetical protein